MNKAGKAIAMGRIALCAGALLMSGSAFAQYYNYEVGPGGPGYGGPPPSAPSGRAARLSQYEVRDLVRGLGYRDVSEPVLRGRQYVVTATDEGAPVAIRVDAYSGRVQDVQPLVYGRAAPEGYYPPEALPPGQNRGGGRTVRPPAPLPPARPYAPEGMDGGMAVQLPPEAVTPDSEGYVPEAAPEPAYGAPPQVFTPQPEGQPAVAMPPQQARATPAVPAPSHAVQQAAPVQPAPVLPQDIGAGVATPGTASAGTASVLSRPTATR